MALYEHSARLLKVHANQTTVKCQGVPSGRDHERVSRVIDIILPTDCDRTLAHVSA